jgi:hypothetical protein
MSTGKSSWRELVRVWAQWFGLALAAIPAGLVLGILEQRGVNERFAIGTALAVGFVLALVMWIWIGRQFAVMVVEYSPAASPTVIQFESELGTYVPAGAFAAAVLVMSVYCIQVPLANHMSTPPLSIARYAPAA